MSNLSPFIKYHRKKLGFTQEELALKAGVGIRFIRDLEQGKKTLQIDKVELVLSLFGFELTPAKQQLDPYAIFTNFLHKAVTISMKNKVKKHGMIIKEIFDTKENKITGWVFVSNIQIINSHQNTKRTMEIIKHNDIQEITEQ